MNDKMRVWWTSQVGTNATFYIPVETVKEAKKLLDILAAYDCFQYNHHIKPDYCNTGGLQVYNEEEQEWEDWYHEDEEDYFDDIDTYCYNRLETADKLKEFTKEIFSQVHFD